MIGSCFKNGPVLGWDPLKTENIIGNIVGKNDII